jgi:hypothetical protein
MKPFTIASAFFASTVVISPAFAGATTDALTSCIADNSTGKDRKDLAQWVFAGMASHPDIKRLSTVDSSTRDDLDRTMAKLSTKLLTESCSKEAKLAVATDGNASFSSAFEYLGKLAMQELMTDPAVHASFSNYTKYLDRAKFDATFSNK